MANDEEVLEEVSLNIRSVTQSCKGGVPLSRLQRDYEELLGKPIPFKDLGYKSLESFIRSIPDVVSLTRNQDGQLLVQGVADATTAHIVSLVSKQKSETKKRGFRKLPPHAIRKGYTNRFTTSRFSARARHISPRRTSPRHTSPKRAAAPIPKYKSSKPVPPAQQHSKSAFKSSETSSHPPSRKYEVAPRFLKLQQQNQNKTPSPPPMEEPFVNEPQMITEPQVPSPTTPVYSEPPMSMPPHIEDCWDPIPPPMIPPPQPSRTLPNRPNRPKQWDNSISAQMNSLNSAGTAKEYVSVYASMNGLDPDYKTIPCGQKLKTKGYLSTLCLGDKKYQSYPEIHSTVEAAEEEAAKKAMQDIQNRMKEHVNSIPETPYGTAEEKRVLMNRIEEIVCEKPSGMFQNGIVREFESKFNERLPAPWLEILRHSNYVEIDEVSFSHGRVPTGASFIIRPTKELSSGNRTPSSTSSRTEIISSDLDTRSLKKSLVDISYPKVPDLVLPPGNEWDVYITNVTGEITARLIDYDVDYLELSNNMSSYYQSNNLPVTNVMPYHMYAAYDEDDEMYHRVLLEDEEMKEEGWSCYFVDEGSFKHIQSENLQEILPAFLKVPFQAIHLKLEGLEVYENCISEDLLMNLLYGKVLIAKVQRCIEVPEFFQDLPGIHRMLYFVTLYDTTEDDVNLNECLKLEVIAALESNCKLPKPSSASKIVYLSHVTDEGQVYLRYTNPKFCWIEYELEKLYPVFEEAASLCLDIPVGTMCVANCGTWHRVKVLSCDGPDNIEVFYVDYGHMGTVSKSQICDLEPISDFLASVPPQALCCELHNARPSPTAQWTPEVTAKLLNFAPFDQELILFVIQSETETSLAKVNLFKRNPDDAFVSINISLACNGSLFSDNPLSPPAKAPTKLPLQSRQSLTNNSLSNVIPDVAVPAEQMAAMRLGSSMSAEDLKWLNTPDDIKSPGAFDLQPTKPLDVPDIPNIREYFDVFVTIVANPHNFIVQPFKMNRQLNELVTEMQSFYSTEDNVVEMDSSILRQNEYYAALHTDNSWYRVRIEKILPTDPVTVAVYYVDFGDYATVSLSNLTYLYLKFKHLPCQAIQAKLAGVMPYESDWDPVHCIEFRNMVMERPFVSIICKKTCQMKDDIPRQSVELQLIDTSDPVKDVCISNLLIERKIARPAPL